MSHLAAGDLVPPVPPHPGRPLLEVCPRLPLDSAGAAFPFVACALYPFAVMRLSQECGCEPRPGSPPRDHFGDFRYTSFTLRISQRWGPYFCQSPPPHTHTHTVCSSGHIQVTLVSSIFCSKSEPLFIAEGRPGHREHRNCAGRALSSSTGPSPFRVHLGGGSAERGMSCPSACPAAPPAVFA